MRLDKEYQAYLRGECKNYNQSLISALQEMEKGGEEKMVYDINGCEECGAARVSGSKLCAACLVKEREILEKEVLIKMVIIDVQRKRIANLERIFKESTAYGFKQNRDNAKLHRYLGELEREMAELKQEI